MTQLNIEQLSAILAALGLSPNDGAAIRDGHGNASAESIQGPLHSFYCYNCSFPNVIPVNAIPTLTAVPEKAPAAATPPAPASTPSSAPAVPNVPSTVPQSTTNQGPSSTPVAGPSIPSATATTTGPDGPWYTVSKGRAVGVFKGWANVTPLVTGVGRSCYFRHPTQAAAQAAFNEAVVGGSVEVLR
ncbi:uncharacterized protein EV420DRAFT_1482013 [Desarmillaria tabescens]|uniref:Ribonuclease H1 N-terminal domain-containing protein n=1 Tax=Armillaria tabescens TaxID=1929756 RepID=A0AA39K1S5_ARMTA|nr:uncharacterized protein EV420DRAFT_1482013 [Desarmillaria tabescens]KAK0453022.1 hypothetical protein EV420DRAFT_1482013 [Desarmillaria tabescens]